MGSLGALRADGAAAVGGKRAREALLWFLCARAAEVTGGTFVTIVLGPQPGLIAEAAGCTQQCAAAPRWAKDTKAAASEY